VLTSPVVRIYFKKLVDQFYPDTVVLSFNEIDTSIQIQALGKYLHLTEGREEFVSTATRDKLSVEEAEELMKRYQKCRSIELRNELVMHYSYIAKVVGVQMRGISSNYAQMEDIVHQGIIALIDCVERFDPTKGIALRLTHLCACRELSLTL
jgi:DNA-directed RNA polymerase sigma subunit (sigma70/sigma32)